MGLSVINSVHAQAATPKEQLSAWRAVVGALIGTWGTGSWGTTGWYIRRGNVWEGKLSMDLQSGPVTTYLPWPANDSVITITPVDSPDLTQYKVVVSGDSFTWSTLTAGRHILSVGPTQILRG